MGLVYPLPTQQSSVHGKEIQLEKCLGKTVLVIGSGGREHAIVDALSRSPQVSKIYCAPGNAGIGLQAFNVPLKDTDVEGLKSFALENQVDLTVVGPESSLAAGLVDAFREAGLAVFGHTKAATRIESSKEFAKELMLKYGIPTAGYRSFSSYDEALEYVAGRPFPAVLKYDGLAAGKGVVIAQDLEEARAALASMLLDEAFGKGRVVVEDFLTGPEFSFLCFVDGPNVYPMPLSQDHKRAFDGDKGPNTGGMGAYTETFAAGRSGLSFISDADYGFAVTKILQPVADAMADAGTPLTGVLYGGLMKTPDGIKVIEFNARFGDPETEVVLPRLETDIYDVFEAVACGTPIPQLHWKDESVLGVVLASNGYPGSYAKGAPIDIAPGYAERVYHMGTKRADDGRLQTAGGRVLMAVASAPSTPEAARRCYAAVGQIQCDNLFYRRDIAKFVL